MRSNDVRRSNGTETEKKIRGGGYKTAYISYLRIAATIVVLFSHVCSILTENTDMFSLTATQHIFYDIFQNLAKWPVPCFFMITGALMLGREREITIRECVTKYAKRMLLALVIFGIPYGMMIVFFDERVISLSMVWKSVLMVINGDSFGHLWYLYVMIGIDLALPLLQMIVKQSSKSLLMWIVGMLFVFDFCVPFLNQLFGISIAFSFPIGTYALLYMFMGYVIEKGYLDKFACSRKWLMLGITVTSAIAVIANIVTGTANVVLAYTSPINVMYSVCIFCFFRNLQVKYNDKLWKIDRLCFGVYLIHPLFIQFAYRFLNFTPAQFEWYPLATMIFTVVFVILSFGASWIMTLIKPLKKYVL